MSSECYENMREMIPTEADLFAKELNLFLVFVIPRTAATLLSPTLLKITNASFILLAVLIKIIVTQLFPINSMKHFSR